MFTVFRSQTGHGHAGGKCSVSHSFSMRPPAVQRQQLKRRRSQLSDRRSPCHAAAAHRVSPPERQASDLGVPKEIKNVGTLWL